MSDINCSRVYKQYGGRSPTSAGLLGAAQALGGMVGLSGAFNPVDSTPIKSITNDFGTLKNKLQEYENTYKAKLSASQEEFKEAQTILIDKVQDFHEEILNDNIQKNSLLIAVIMAILAIIIIYLAIL